MKRLFSWLLTAILLISLFSVSGISVSAASFDMAVTDFDWNTATEIAPGTRVTFSVTVKNESTTPIVDTFVVTFGTPQATFSTVTYADGIDAGESVTIQSTPWTAVEGDYMVAVRVNATDTVNETNKRNNTMQANLRVSNKKLTSAYASTQAMLEENDLTTLIFSDDFNDLTSVDTTNSGAEGYKWYVSRALGASTLTTNDYSVKNGVMSVHNVKPTYNYGLCTYNAVTRLGFTYNTGYMEIRLRIPRPRKNESDEKGVPAIWALPPNKLTNSARSWVEMDWMEYWGINGYNSDRPGGFYTICLHEQHLTGTTVTTHYKNSNYQYEGLGDAEWHVMGWLWQEGLFIVYFDGVEVMRQTYGTSQAPNPHANTIKGDSSLSKVGVYSALDTQFNPIIIGGSQDNPMELDYVRVWNGNRTADPDPIISNDAVAQEFIAIYATDADGKPIKTVTEDTYGYVLAGETEWNAFNNAVKTKIDSLLQANGQPTFSQLLAQAKGLLEGPEQTTTSTKKPTSTTKKPTSTTTKQPTVKPTGGHVVSPVLPTTTLPSATVPTTNSGTVTMTTTAAGTTTTGTASVDTDPTTHPDPSASTTTTILAGTTTVAPTQATKPADTEPQATPFPWAAVAIPAGAVLLAAVIVLIVKLKKK